MISKIALTRPSIFKTFGACAAAILLQLWAAPSDAQSRRVFVEFDGPSVGTSSGDAWVITTNAAPCKADDAGFTDTDGKATTPGPAGTGSVAQATCGIDFSNALTDTPEFRDSTRGIELGFNIRIGDKLYHTIYIDRFGYVTFGTAPSDGRFTTPSAQTVAALQVQLTGLPFIAPFYAKLVIPDGPIGNFAPFGGGASYFRGFGDPIAPYNASETLPAFAVTWMDATNSISTQMVLYQKNAAGDFYLDLRYGNNDPDSYDLSAPLPAIAGFALTSAASDRVQLAGPLPLAAGSFYEFDGGHLLSTTPPPPPPARCDVDSDKDIDLNDLLDIAHAFGHKASSKTDPRDSDANGVINLKDLLKCIQKCTRKYCAIN